MAVKLDTITHGQSSWEKAVNGNFSKLNQDTGVVNMTLVGAVKGLETSPIIRGRRVNGIVHLTGGITATADIPNQTLIVSLPENFLGNDGSVVGFARNIEGTAVPVTIRKNGIYTNTTVKSGDTIDFSSLTYLGSDI